MKKVLVFGATGAMGLPLVKILSKNPDWQVFGTSRNKREIENINWLQGNAHDLSWIKTLLDNNSFDAIVDFFNYSTNCFNERYEYLLSHTNHYIFTSSARVYAINDGEIDEKSNRILDICTDEDYLLNDSYDLAKARQEDLLNRSKYNNFTIIRPSLTYNNNRLQFTIFEKDEWLHRILDGNSMVFPCEIEKIRTTMSYGNDVAYAISKLLLSNKAVGETFNICGGGSLSWGEVLGVYISSIEKEMQKKIKVKKILNVEETSKKLNRYYQYRYARGVDRIFTNKKIESVIGPIKWTTIEEGLSRCIHEFFLNGANINTPPFPVVAYLDRLTNEHTPLSRFNSFKQKTGFVLSRFGLYR